MKPPRMTVAVALLPVVVACAGKRAETVTGAAALGRVSMESPASAASDNTDWATRIWPARFSRPILPAYPQGAIEQGVAPPTGLGPLRADVLGRLGRFAEAEAVLREDIRSFPGRSQTYASLAVMVALQGRPRVEVHEILESMVKASPGRETLLLGAKTLDFLGDKAGARAWRGRASSASPRPG